MNEFILILLQGPEGLLWPSLPRVSLSPKPSLSAWPGPVVAPGGNVTLRCRGILRAGRFALYKAGAAEPVRLREEAGDGAEFLFTGATTVQQGRYSCRYQTQASPGAWSEPSDPLVMLVTDKLPKPSLVALPGPVLTPGTNVSLRCQGLVGGMSFALYRVGRPGPLQYLDSAWAWADFALGGPGTSGTYSCYYHTPAAPYVLSERSDPLVISLAEPASLDYTLGNTIRLGLAGLVFIALGGLVFLDWLSRKAGNPKPFRLLPPHPLCRVFVKHLIRPGTALIRLDTVPVPRGVHSLNPHFTDEGTETERS
uniref:Ig-like domain-containing protein n=1 Tax=Ornithorhynchus anatinus TaxID=9258 RepID=A0A6I8NPI8_ORNAN